MDLLAIVAMFLGGVIALMGYRIYMDILQFWGMLILGTIGAYLATLLFPAAGGTIHLSVPLVTGFLIGGLIGALVARPMTAIVIFATGFIGGFLISSVAYYLILGGANILLAVILGAALGAVALWIREMSLMIATGFIGASMFIYGLTNILTIIPPLITAVIFFLVGFFGAASQYNGTRRAG